MPFPKSSGAKSEIDHKLKSKRQQIIEEERIRVLGDSLMLFYDKLMENYVLAYPLNEDDENEIQLVGLYRLIREIVVISFQNSTMVP